jgi:formylglycine-generating enzyme required for sulfatase activity
MKRFMPFFLLAALLLGACKNVFINNLLGENEGSSPIALPPTYTAYKVLIGTLEHGAIIAKPDSGPAGSQIILQVSPEPGYKLKSGTLHYNGALGVVPIDETTRSFTLPAYDVTVSAEFELLPAGNHSISVMIGTLDHGIIIAHPEYGTPGTQINLSVIPDPGYRYSKGTLKYKNATEEKSISDTTRSFLLPNQNVTIFAEFEVLPPGNYTVRVGNLNNGRIFPIPEYGEEGTEIYLHTVPDPGFILKPGSLKYTDVLTDTPIDENTRIFSLPAKHVTINADFVPAPPGTYTVRSENILNGRILARPEYGKPGTIIYLQAIPDPGYMINPGTLKYTGAQGEASIDEMTQAFPLPAAHVTVTAEFKPIPAGNYSVRISMLSKGSIIAFPKYGTPGTVIRLQVNPDPGYRLKAGSLAFRDSSGGITKIDEVTEMFTLPASHVTVLAEFEALKAGYYTVKVNPLLHGRIIAQPKYAPAGADIFLWVIPDAGYKLESGTLQFKDSSGVPPRQIDEKTRTFKMPNSHVLVNAQFTALPKDQYTVRIEPLAHGRIIADPAYGPNNTLISLSVIPDSEYVLKHGSLKYQKTGGTPQPINETTRPPQFNIPGDHVTVFGDFETAAYEVTIAPVGMGVITAVPLGGPAGTVITLQVAPDNGNRLVPGSLKYLTAGGETTIDPRTLRFTMPSEDVTITVQFVPFTALKDLALNGRPVQGLMDGKTDYTFWVPGQENNIHVTFTAGQGATAKPESGITTVLQALQKTPVQFTINDPDGITKTTYTLTLIRELVPTEAVPAGSFQRDKDGANISVISDAYRIGKYELTQYEWETVMGYPRGNPSGNTYPVNNINWYETLIFCNKLSILEEKTPVYVVNGQSDPALWSQNKSQWTSIQIRKDANGYRLPSEMEWLWAAMGADYYNRGQPNTQGYTYSYAGIKLGHKLADAAWYDKSHAEPVKQKKPNELGLYDITGNVGEWCGDWYNGNSEYGITGQITDYTGPASGSARVVRGGNYVSSRPETFFFSFRGGNYNSIVLPFSDPTAEVSRIGVRILCQE